MSSNASSKASHHASRSAAVADWSIPRARERAREMQRDIEHGRDPRLVKAERQAEDEATRAAAKSAELTGGEVWTLYLEDRKTVWGVRHHEDHLRLSKRAARKPSAALSAEASRSPARCLP